MIDFKQLAKEHAKILINKENELMINEKILKDRVRKLLKEYMDNPEFDMPQSYYDQYSAPIDKIRSRQMSNAFKPNDTTSDEFAMDWFNSEPQDEVLTEENPTQPFEIGQDVLVWGTKSNRWFDAVIKRIDDGSAMVFVPKVQQMLSAPFDAIKSRKMNITGLSDQDVQSRYDRIKDELTLDEEDLSLMENVIRKIAKSEYKRMIKEYTDEQKKKLNEITDSQFVLYHQRVKPFIKNLQRGDPVAYYQGGKQIGRIDYIDFESRIAHIANQDNPNNITEINLEKIIDVPMKRKR